MRSKILILIILVSCFFYACADKNKSFVEALESCDAAAIEKALKEGADPNMNIENITPLNAAIICKSEKVAEVLLKAGANPNEVDADGWGILSYAAGKKGNSGVVKQLLAAGANINPPKGCIALMSAIVGDVEIETLQMLIKAGVDPNTACVGKSDRFPFLNLVIVNRGNDKEAVLLLLNAGADISVKDRKGRTALMLAEEKGYNEIAEIIKTFQKSAGKK